MGRESKRLTARAVATISKPGMHADGQGLYLKVDKSGAKRWAFIFFWPHPSDRTKTKRTEMGLGRLGDLSLAEAREKAAEARRQVAAHTNPIEARKAALAADRAIVPTFGQVAEDYIKAQTPSFRNEKHLWQWSQTLGDGYCANLRKRPIDQVTTEDVLGVLQPIWLEKNETASRIRGRIERVLDAAKARSLRTGENPARWRGHLDKLLPKRQKLQRGHHPAMPYVDIPVFLDKLAVAGGIGALALRFCVLNASRTGEILGAKWSEFDLEKGIWTVPPERMKAGREHRVPMSGAALQIIKGMAEARAGEFVFGTGPNRAISNMTMAKALKTAGAGEFTVHGFRSSFRDWVSEETSFSGDLAEAALAHIIGNETERAYRRGDALAKRRQLMDAWAEFCTSTRADGKVVAMRAKPGLSAVGA